MINQELNPIQRKILSLYPTYQKFVNEQQPKQLLVNFDDINTVEQSLQQKRLTISDIDIIYPDPAGNINNSVKYLVGYLEFINNFSNIGKPLTELYSVAYMIYKNYGHFYLCDLKIVFERLMRAEYGTFYGSVDAQRILYSFMQYNIERSQTLSKKKNKYFNDLELHLDKVRKDVDSKVREIMKESFSELVGMDYWDKKKELEEPLLRKELADARENFLQNYENNNQ